MTKYYCRFTRNIKISLSSSRAKFPIPSAGKLKEKYLKEMLEDGQSQSIRKPIPFHHQALLFNRNVIVGRWLAKLEFAVVFISVPATSRLFFNIRSISVSFETISRHETRASEKNSRRNKGTDEDERKIGKITHATRIGNLTRKREREITIDKMHCSFLDSTNCDDIYIHTHT